MKITEQKVSRLCFFWALLSGLLVFSNRNCHSQEIPGTPPEYKNTIGVRVAQSRTGDTQTQPLKDYDALFGYGISYDRKFTRLIHIETGLYFLRKQLVTSAFSDPVSEIPYEFYNLRLPILFKLSTTYLYTSLGFNVDYNFKHTSVSDYYHDIIENENDLQPVVLGASLNIGVQVPVLERFLLNVEAGVMPDLTAYISKDSHTGKFTGYGYSAGMSYKF